MICNSVHYFADNIIESTVIGEWRLVIRSLTKTQFFGI